MQKILNRMMLVFSLLSSSAFAQKAIIDSPKKNNQHNQQKINDTANFQTYFSIGNFTGTKVKVEEFKKEFSIQISDEYVLSSMMVYFAGAGFQQALVISLSGNSSGVLKKYLDKCVVGSIVAFDNIVLKGKAGFKKVPGKKFNLY